MLTVSLASPQPSDPLLHFTPPHSLEKDSAEYIMIATIKRTEKLGVRD